VLIRKRRLACLIGVREKIPYNKITPSRLGEIGLQDISYSGIDSLLNFLSYMGLIVSRTVLVLS
jgi:hypothetical protein